MEIPVLSGLDKRFKDKWDKQFIRPGRTAAEGIWRRTQEEKTKDQSGWKSQEDQRRRMIHFYDEYDVVDDEESCKLIIKNVYLWVCSTLPADEARDYVEHIYSVAKTYGWDRDGSTITKDELEIRISVISKHPEDVKEGRSFPSNYETVEVIIRNSDDLTVNEYQPWGILKSGIRTKGTRISKPHLITTTTELKRFAPFQFELGGGASIELGIPPLNHLHQVYAVTDIHTKKFLFGKDDHLITDILEDYEKFYREKASCAYAQSLLAEPNIFYEFLMQLYSEGVAVGDVITNNFDGLVSLVGLHERYVRKYEDTDIVPAIQFHPDAKSLVVVGSHADRRLIQEAARRKGLVVIYVDPEMYFDYKGNSIEYPLETIKNEDFLIQMDATVFAKRFNALIKKLGIE